jgi:hypothetical protein
VRVLRPIGIRHRPAGPTAPTADCTHPYVVSVFLAVYDQERYYHLCNVGRQRRDRSKIVVRGDETVRRDNSQPRRYARKLWTVDVATVPMHPEATEEALR